MKITALFTAFLVQSAAGISVKRAAIHQLFTAESPLTHSRTERAVNSPICSANMQKITKLARVAGELFMDVDESSLYRRSRNHVKLVNLEQPVGSFCKKLWLKLLKVEGDLKTIAGFLEEYHLASQTVELLMRSVQEMMNQEGTNYEISSSDKAAASHKGRLNIDMVKERAQIQLAHVINELSSLEVSCSVQKL